MDRKASGEVSKGEVPKPKENVGSGKLNEIDKKKRVRGYFNTNIFIKNYNKDMK